MEPPSSAAEVNAFKFQNSDESLSEDSNMSGTFNKLNNSLKVNQRRQKKLQKSENHPKELESDSDSKKNEKIKIEIKPAPTPKPILNIPPPPKLLPYNNRSFQMKLPSPPQLLSINDKAKSTPQQPDKSLSSISKNGSKQINSPPSKKREETAIIKEESQDFSMKSGQSSNNDLEQKLSDQESQDQRPVSEDPFVINVNLKDNGLNDKSPPPKIPNNNNALFIQAKYVLYQSLIKNEQSFSANEIGLSQVLTLLHTSLLKQREEELQKILSDQGRQILILQQQLSVHASQSKKKQDDKQSIENTPTLRKQESFDETKKLKEENQELRMKNQILESDLQFQAQKTKDLQNKYENEIENLRSQLKGSQSEQFVKQQIEHKKLIEDNALLMREVKILQDQLKDEQQKVIDLFEDAQAVREEILKEMSEFEKTKGQLEKMKKLNQNLKKRLNEQSLEFSDLEADSLEEDETPEGETTLGADISRNKKKKKLVSEAVS